MPLFFLQDASARNIIIIHPGSYYVRIGRASDVNPTTVLHAVARKRFPGGHVYVDSFLPTTSHKVYLWIAIFQIFENHFQQLFNFYVDVKNTECMKEVEEARLQVSRFLQSQNQSSGRRRYVTPPQQIAAFNRFILIALLSIRCHFWHLISITV